jgi:non-ribosomal peptide synthetase component F
VAERLAGASGVLDLPTDRPRPAMRQARGASERFALPADLTAGLADLSRREGATLFMTLAAGLSALLARHTGDEDLLLGTPVAGRTRAEVEGLIGFFINTLVLRADLTGDPSFSSLLARVRDAALGAWAHQDLPFERLVEALQPERDLSRPPLVQVLLVLQNVPLGRLELPGLVLEPLEVDAASVPFDLVVGLIETTEGLRGTVDYDRTLFDRTTIRRLLDRFETLLAAAVATPEVRLSLLDPLRPAERHQLLVEWNEAPATAVLPGLLVHEMFALQAARTPNAPAVLFAGPEGDQVVTYGELARRVDALAGHLRALGAGPEAPVAVVCERSPELLVAYLGALAAGCPYIPIDPAVPADRVAWMVADAGAAAVLTRERIKDLKDVKDLNDRKDTRDLEDLPSFVSFRSFRSFTSFRSFAPHLAQIIYTSGSTGRPKGVMVSHGSLASRVRACVELFGFGPADRQMQFVALGFDPVGEEVFPLLASGGGVILHPDPAGLSAAELLDVCDRLGATKINLPGPALPLVLSELIGGRRPRTMRIFATGAASPSAERLAAWSRRRPDQRFFNLYGPTEGTIFATWHAPELRPEVLEPLLRVPIGRPLADSAIYLVDVHLQPVPPGAFPRCPPLSHGRLGPPPVRWPAGVPGPHR